MALKSPRVIQGLKVAAAMRQRLSHSIRLVSRWVLPYTAVRYTYWDLAHNLFDFSFHSPESLEALVEAVVAEFFALRFYDYCEGHCPFHLFTNSVRETDKDHQTTEQEMYQKKSLPSTIRAPSIRIKNAKGVFHDKLGTSSSDVNSLEWLDVIDHCPVYHPSKEEFEDPLRFVQKIAPEASKFGICKIVSPLSSSPTPAGVVLMTEKKGFKFSTQVQPLRLGKWNNEDMISFLNRGRNYTLREFEVMANKEAARRYGVSGCLPPAYVERQFWNEMINGKKGTVEYGVNVDGTAFSSSSSDLLSGSNSNLEAFPHHKSSALRLVENDIPGVTGPMLYIGMLFSMFAWHVEDHYLYSINYHHCGASKTWYGVPGSAALQFEKVVQHSVYDQEILSVKSEDGAFNVLANKTTMFPPKILLRHGVPVYKAVQMPGEFVITFPRAYHAGFSHGFNCGEAVNFATNDWFPFGIEASHRYAVLTRMPIIPYEELLCKEAMQLSQASDHGTRSRSDFLASLRGLKISFVFLLRLHHYARWRINKLKPSLNLQTRSERTIICILCRRDCYLGYYTCQCYTDPICIFHESLIFNCPCGSDCHLIIRDGILKMEALAKTFDQGREINHEVENQIKRFSYLWKSDKVLKVEDEYAPFSEIKCTKKRRREPVEKSKIRLRFPRKAHRYRRLAKNLVVPKCSHGKVVKRTLKYNA
ncbi:OLC1v1027812C1 [Oldenlandia corymbosa var. corymbosa]|uniref:OLC1v1027812C1 n=1 Tax=Oldenlandia corymbosa var. corymbosa TaxID=529605 RepID=A0AAV1CC53_OLDCO|nr:OLC1v1027812C1 [Oldenlandia corymbosa var. corymbosa]